MKKLLEENETLTQKAAAGVSPICKPNFFWNAGSA